MKNCLETAYAKLNLHLEVLGVRDDGYHNILSLMTAVSLADLLQLERIERKQDGMLTVNIFSSGGQYSSLLAEIPAESNLITRAAKLYCKKIGFCGQIDVSIEKNIPAGAGMGGGSSDAAAMLRLLNQYFGMFDNSELCVLGEQLGADVPFCIRGGTALCEGTGNIIEQIEGVLPHTVVIANNGIHVHTGEAFGYIDALQRVESGKSDISLKKEIIRRAFTAGDFDIMRPVLKNDFEQPVFEKHDSVKVLKERLYSLGADWSSMTGSGSTVIGLFGSHEKALQAVHLLKADVSLAVEATCVCKNY